MSVYYPIEVFCDHTHKWAGLYRSQPRNKHDLSNILMETVTEMLPSPEDDGLEPYTLVDGAMFAFTQEGLNTFRPALMKVLRKFKSRMVRLSEEQIAATGHSGLQAVAIL